MHWTVTKWSSRPMGVTKRDCKIRYWRTEPSPGSPGLGSATTEYTASGVKIVRFYQFWLSAHCWYRPEGIFRWSWPLLVTGFVVPEGEMPNHHAINPQVAKGAYMGKWKVNETEKRRTTGQPHQPVIVQHHVTWVGYGNGTTGLTFCALRRWL